MLRIVIGQRGWVWIGKYEEHGDEVTLTDAKCIRRWGTTTGLGELCNGPLKDTVLDPVGTIRLHRLAIVATYDACESGWSGKTCCCK
jgi:exosome complex RNA-binding protein Rrp4